VSKPFELFGTGSLHHCGWNASALARPMLLIGSHQLIWQGGAAYQMSR
jgi:hypothetical protein